MKIYKTKIPLKKAGFFMSVNFAGFYFFSNSLFAVRRIKESLSSACI